MNRRRSGSFSGILLGKMDVIVYVLLTEAVVAGAAGAVAKFQLRMVRIGAAADRALVLIEIGLLLPADALGFLAEVHGIGAGSAGHGAHKVGTAEDEEVYYRHHGQQVCREAAGNDAHYKERGVEIGKVLYLDGQYIEKQHLHLREEHGEGEEHGQIHILGRQTKAGAGDKIHHKAVKHGKHNAGNEIEVELGRAPILFKGGAYHVIKIHGDKGEKARAGGDERKGHDTPDLPAEYQRGIEGEIGIQHRIDRAHKPENYVGYGNILHKIGHAEVGVLSAKAFNKVHWVFHICYSCEAYWAIFY